MFENLSDRILKSVKKIKGQSRITPANIEETLREIRLSLLEADVHYRVVKNFIERVQQKSLGVEVMQSLSPGQQFVKIVYDELVQLLGGGAQMLDVREKPTVIFLVGLQGAGKTTTAAKLALYVRQKLGKKPGLVSADIYRPAAMDQLQILAEQNEISFFPAPLGTAPEEILARAYRWARDYVIDVLIVDTAGRMQVDEELMKELQRMRDQVPPQEVLLVADAMLGQQSVQVAEGFHQRMNLSGLVLTKVDGDARGGAALSIREVTGIPIKFLGQGEKVTALEVFHPDRLAGRILDQGDVLSLVEKAQEVIDQKEAEKSARRMMSQEFSLEDFLQQIQMVKKMGGMQSLLQFIPGMGQAMKQMQEMGPPEAEIKKVEAIIRSMTPQERSQTKILNSSRRQRIASGSGTRVQDVNRLIRQFEEAKKMMGPLMKMAGGKIPGFGMGKRR